MQARHRLVAGLLASVVLVVAVMLVRQEPGAPPVPPGPTAAEASVAPVPTLLGPDDLVGVFAELSSVGPLGRRSQDGPVGDVADPDGPATVGRGCRALRPDGPGSPVRGWQVSGQVASLALLREGTGSEVLPLEAWLPADVVDLLLRTASSPQAVERLTPVSRADLAVMVQVVTVPVPGGELLLSDLGLAGGHRWAELRTPAAVPCALARKGGRVVGDGSGSTADADGWGGLRFGTPVAELVRSGLLPGLAAAIDAPGCRSWQVAPGGPPGLGSVLVQDGVLLAVGLRSGSVRAGAAPRLSVGSATTQVRAAFPDQVGPGELRALQDNSGVVVPLPRSGGPALPGPRSAEDRRVVVSAAKPSAVVDDVDVPVTGPSAVVSSLLVGLPCSGG